MQPTFIFVLICQGNELCDDKLRYFHEATNQSAENGPGEKTAILRVACASLQKLPAPFSTQNDLWKHFCWAFFYLTQTDTYISFFYLVNQKAASSCFCSPAQKPKFCPPDIALLLMLLLPLLTTCSGMPCTHPCSVSQGSMGW